MRFRNGLWVPEAPNLILGRGPCPRPTIELGLDMPKPLVQGIFTWELGKFTKGRNFVREKGTVVNIITDAGLDAMGTTTNTTNTGFVGVGTSSTAPATGQTALGAEVGRVSRHDTGDLAVTSGTAFAYWSMNRVYLFLETEGNGNLTELGTFNQASGGTMFSRQLFKDLGGVPTTVVKTSADQLRITYELRVYPPTADVFQSGLVISGTSYDFQTRAREIDSTPWVFFLQSTIVFSSPTARAYDATATLGTTSGSLGSTIGNTQADTSVFAGYGAGTFFRDCTHKWEPGTANYAGGIGGFHTSGSASQERFQSLVTPAFNKDATKRLTLVVRSAWARYP